jgi:hypothetical protein
MPGHGKSFVFYHYLTAYNTCWKGIEELDEFIRGNEFSPSGEGIRRIDLLETDLMSPEETLIHKDALEKLSSEAKEVIILIFNAPKEILETLAADKYDKVSKRKIRDFLIREKGWERANVKKCFRELKLLFKDF